MPKHSEKDSVEERQKEKENVSPNRTRRGRSKSPSPHRNKKVASKQTNQQRDKKVNDKRDRSRERSKRTPSRDEDKVNNNVERGESEVTYSEGEGEATENNKEQEVNRKQRKENQKQEKQKKKGQKQDETKKNNEQKGDKKRANKIYRAPPTPPPEWFTERERTFVLDCVAVDTMSRDYSRVRPKMGQVIPPYNSAHDPSVAAYFQCHTVQKTLKLNEQIPGEPIEGRAVEKFFTSGEGYKYLSYRNRNGAGHSADTVGGHGQFMSGVGPISGYNGRFGYRRTTPNLRQYPSTFGTVGCDPLY